MKSSYEYDICLFYDKPINYKGLDIYPVTMDKYLEFHFYVNCLLLDKNSVPDVKVISMSYLRFLYHISKESNMPYLAMCVELLKIVLHIDDSSVFKFKTTDGDKNAVFYVGDKEFDSNDFNTIVDIIFMQNGIEHIDDTIQKEVRDAMEEAESYKMKQNSYKMGSLEDQMVCVLISTSLTLEEIYNLTIRKFTKILARVDHKLHYEIYLSAQASGMIEIKDKDKLKHWMADLTKDDKYSDVKVDADEMHQKIDAVNK